jgi:hypothetical protein
MPAEVNIKVGSLRGTSDDEGTMIVLSEKVEKGRADLVDAGHMGSSRKLRSHF